MKKAVAIIVVVLLVVGAFFAGLNCGTVKPYYDLEKSSLYSEEDIKKCAKLAVRDIRRDETIRLPLKIYYSDEWSDHARSFIDQIDDCDSEDNILEIKADFWVGGVSQSFERYSMYYDWSFIFYRKDANSPWILYTQGYG